METGTLADLRHLTRTSISAELAGPPNGIAQLPGVHDVEVRGLKIRLQADTDKLDAVLRSLADSGVRSLTSTPPTLEELFLRHYADDVHGNGNGNGNGADGGVKAGVSR